MLYVNTLSNNPFAEYTDLTKDERKVRNAPLRDAINNASREDLIRMLLTCPITGVPNGMAWECAEKQQVMAMIDLDSLKYVNDTYGHPVGDAMLKKFAQEMTIAGVQVYHVSGDEFYCQFEDSHTAIRALHRLQRRSAGWEFGAGNVTLKGIGFSFGQGSTQSIAESVMAQMKEQRELAGVRAPRGCRPQYLIDLG